MLCKLFSKADLLTIHNLKCFVNWTVTELQVLAILSRIYYFAIFDVNRDCFSQKILSSGTIFGRKNPELATCQLSKIMSLYSALGECGCKLAVKFTASNSGLWSVKICTS